MNRFNDNVEGRQGLVHLSDCTSCPSYSILNFHSPLSRKGYDGRCMLGKTEQRKLGLVELRGVPCMDRELTKKRFNEWDINGTE